MACGLITTQEQLFKIGSCLILLKMSEDSLFASDEVKLPWTAFLTFPLVPKIALSVLGSVFWASSTS